MDRGRDLVGSVEASCRFGESRKAAATAEDAPSGAPRADAGEASAHRRSQRFGDRLARQVAERRSQLVLGLDPDPARLWPRAIEGAGGASEAPSSRAARAVALHCAMAIEAAGEHCAAIKPQVACFERLGAPGWSALAETVQRAREHRLLVIADAKRGDIDITAAAYAHAYFGETPTPFGAVPSLGADAMTVNPLLGADSLGPMVSAARSAGGGLFVLTRTSNPGAADVQELALAAGGSVSERIAAIVAELGAPSVGEGGLADIGAVVGATAPEWLERLRELMPHAPFLLPGIGAQGGRVEVLAPAFAPGPAGGLISASRGIVFAHERLGGDPARAARDEAARLRGLAWDLAR